MYPQKNTSKMTTLGRLPEGLFELLKSLKLHRHMNSFAREAMINAYKQNHITVSDIFTLTSYLNLHYNENHHARKSLKLKHLKFFVEMAYGWVQSKTGLLGADDYVASLAFLTLFLYESDLLVDPSISARVFWIHQMLCKLQSGTRLVAESKDLASDDDYAVSLLGGQKLPRLMAICSEKIRPGHGCHNVIKGCHVLIASSSSLFLNEGSECGTEVVIFRELLHAMVNYYKTQSGQFRLIVNDLYSRCGDALKQIDADTSVSLSRYFREILAADDTKDSRREEVLIRVSEKLQFYLAGFNAQFEGLQLPQKVMMNKLLDLAVEFMWLISKKCDSLGMSGGTQARSTSPVSVEEETGSVAFRM